MEYLENILSENDASKRVCVCGIFFTCNSLSQLSLSISSTFQWEYFNEWFIARAICTAFQALLKLIEH